MDQSADRMETSKEDTVEDQMQILDVCKENGHFSHGNTLLSEQNEDSSKILIKYHQSSEVSLQTLSTSEEVLQEVEKDCIESIDSSEAHEIAQNTTIGEPTAAENQRNPLCPKKSIPIITISLEEVTNFDMNKQELIETDETPILSTEDQLPHQEQIEDTKQKDIIVFELSNLEKKSVVVLEAIKEETGAEVTPDLESSQSDHLIVTKEENYASDQEVSTTTISPTINMDSVASRSTEFENSTHLPTNVEESKLDNEALTDFETIDQKKVGKVSNESKAVGQDPIKEGAGNLEANVEKVTPNLDSSSKVEHPHCIEASTVTPVHTHLSTNSTTLLKNCPLSEKNDEMDDESDVLRDKSSVRGDVKNRQENGGGIQTNQPPQQQSSPQILTVGEIDTTSIQLVEDSGKEEKMKEQVNLRRNLRSAVSLRDESNTSPTPPPRRLSLRRQTVQTASEYSGLNSPDRRSLVSLPRGRLYFPSNGLPATPEEPTRTVRKEKRTMFSWLGGDSSKKKNKEVLESVSEGLRKIYKQKLYPLEEFYKFNEFHSPFLDDPDFDAKPMILLVGQYSTGKTTFIRYLLEQDFPGIRIGPEPTTDRFIAVMNANEEGVIPGNALVVDAKKQFRALSGFGNAFLNRFQCSTLPNQVLESVTIVDTPGILSGEKQRIDRGYDFTGVLEWFAERVDRIILLFDAHKLDISDEFKRCIEALAGNEDKIRIVLNKSDMVDHQQLMRVYGALMWSLGKVFKTPEVSRVYIGTFWDHPLHYDINRRLFQDEQHDLFADLQALPRNAALRKLNDLIKRARLAKVHAYIINELRKQMPTMLGKDKKKKELIQGLDKIYEQLQREHNISPGDFPDIQKMREKLEKHDFSKFNPLKPKLIEVVDGMLAHDIARLMTQIPKEEAAAITAAANPDKSGPGPTEPAVRGGAFSQAVEAETPFGFGKGEGFDKGADETEWVVNKERTQFDSTFDDLGPVGGYLSGRVAKEHMVKSKLPNSVLGKIWKLADVDKDGQLDSDEFALANYLINLKLEGHELPSDLPKHLVPPSKRSVANGTADQFYPKLEDDE